MEKIIRFNKLQAKKIDACIKDKCCNYDSIEDSCILFDDICPQMLTFSLVCKWFINAVLPDNQDLYKEIILGKSGKHCAECGKEFIPGSNRAKYCPDCSSRIRHKKEKERQRSRRSVRN